MIAITRDADWAERLDAIAGRGGWPFAAVDGVPDGRGSVAAERAVVVLDRASAGSNAARAVAVVRGLYPSARVALAMSEAEVGAAGAASGVESGADEIVLKSWSDATVAARLGALRDAALASAARVSADGDLKAEVRSRRAFVRARGKWAEVPLSTADFALLYALLGEEGEALTRERLLAEMRRESGRGAEPETVARRILCLRRALSGWKGEIETVRGGRYRLVSSRRRSTT